MAASRQEDLLEPVDLPRTSEARALPRPGLPIAGISRMQLDYWTTKARIPTKGKKQRLYDLDAVETVMLIKQGKDKGLSLQAAIEATQRFKTAKAPRVPRRN